jgi:hypothetical protein
MVGPVALAEVSCNTPVKFTRLSLHMSDQSTSALTCSWLTRAAAAHTPAAACCGSPLSPAAPAVQQGEQGTSTAVQKQSQPVACQGLAMCEQAGDVCACNIIYINAAQYARMHAASQLLTVLNHIGSTSARDKAESPQHATAPY